MPRACAPSKHFNRLRITTTATATAAAAVLGLAVTARAQATALAMILINGWPRWLRQTTRRPFHRHIRRRRRHTQGCSSISTSSSRRARALPAERPSISGARLQWEDWAIDGLAPLRCKL